MVIQIWYLADIFLKKKKSEPRKTANNTHCNDKG